MRKFVGALAHECGRAQEDLRTPVRRDRGDERFCRGGTCQGPLDIGCAREPDAGDLAAVVREDHGLRFLADGLGATNQERARWCCLLGLHGERPLCDFISRHRR